MFSTRIFTNSEGRLVRNNKFNPLTGIRELRASRARVGTHRGRKGPGAQAGERRGLFQGRVGDAARKTASPPS